MAAATVAMETFQQCVREELLMESRLEANPNCPQAQSDYEIAAAATDYAESEVERLGGNW